MLGAGVAGLATALALLESGWQVGVRERAQTPARAGMGFLLMANGLRALARLGLAQDVRRLGVIADGSVVLRPDGSTVEARRFAPHLGLARASLIDLLSARLPDGVVRYGCEALADTEADLEVGADGRHSTMREFVAPGHRAAAGEIAEVISTVAGADIVARLGSTLVRVRHAGGGLGGGVVPTSGGTLIWYLTLDTRRWPTDGDQASLRERVALVADWPWPFPELLRRTDPATTYLWRTTDCDPVPSMVRERVALVGDAAHPLLPFSTQGVNSALVDAVTLADALVATDPIEPALRAWSGRRRPILCDYARYGRQRAAAFLDPQRTPHDPVFPAAAGRRDLRSLVRPRPTRPLRR